MEAWGTIEVEPEVEEWLHSLDEDAFGHARYHVDRLGRFGVHLGEPLTRQLRGPLRELRFYQGREQVRVTYYITRGRRIILLTVFRKTRRREAAEIARGYEAMQRCIREGHTAEEDAR